ncbi:MAG TPA: hypothetical protein ENK85_00730 [Saprospiraceae bacterium]|nr:hypothetical protein [Saprospiraceae bacterium]
MRWIFLLLLLGGMTGCEDPKDFSKDYKTRKIVDSLFRKELMSLNPQLDKQCSIQTTLVLDNMVDSILLIRRQEVEEILKREALENATKN